MSPWDIPSVLRTAIQCHQTGQQAQAEELYRSILATYPDHDGALEMLGVLYVQDGRHDLGIESLRRAVAIQPKNPIYYDNLGNALNIQGNPGEAAQCHRRAVELDPGFADAHNNLGVVLNRQGQFHDAVASFRQALLLKPNYVEAHNNLGNTLKNQRRLEEAAACFRRALELEPGYPDARINLGNVLLDEDKALEAAACYRQVLQRNPNSAVAHKNLGSALIELSKLDEATAHFDEAIRLSPQYAEAHQNRACLFLRRGDFERGWAAYEWRRKTDQVRSPRHAFTHSEWDGSPLEGRTILLHAEQGFGDTLQFIRFAPLVAQAGGTVIVDCQESLKRLFQYSLPHAQVVGYGEPLPSFDVYCPLMSLPMVFRTTLETLPRQVPYIRADTELIAKWRSKLAGDSGPLKVGLVWAGRPDNQSDRTRSMALRDLAPLAQVPHVRFYSLQKGEPAQQALGPGAGMPLVDWTDELHDFADTAALIANLDLVISVCTSVAHLAGAMGKPVWTLLRFAACWRWLRDRDDSPWYPMMRLFRQPTAGDWPSVVRSVADELGRLRDSE